MKSCWIFCCFILAVLFNLQIAESKYIEGHLQTKEDWEFLARFCFLSDKGRLQFEFEYPQLDYDPQNILLYYDEADQWPAVYKKDLTCEQKKGKLRPENNQIIKLSLFYAWAGCKVHNDTGVATLKCKGGRSFVSARERWWYIAVSKCNTFKGLNLKYKMWMTNGDPGDTFYRHFSADEFYILQTDIAFLVVFILMFVLSVVCAVILRSRQLFHTTYKLYMTSLVCQVVYLLIMCINYGKYANDGVEDRGLETFGRIFEAVSMLVFLLMLILMGKGYTITRGRLSTSGSIKIAVFMTFYTIVYVVLFIYEAVFFDPGEVLYIYESPPGYGLIGLRLIAWVWFCYAIFFTLKHYPEKSSFYYPFFVFYTLWFLAMPAFVLIAYFAIPKWAREKIVNGIMLAIAFFAYTFFLFLTRPTAANRNFPYHVRTSQIGVMTGTTTQNGVPQTASPGTDSFAPHAYAPTSDPPAYYNGTNGNFHELFTVSQTRSQKEPVPDPNIYSTIPDSNGNIDKYPRSAPGNNPFIVTK